MGALALALLYSVGTPQTQENMRNTANSVFENAKKAGGVAKEEVQRQIKISTGFWMLITLTVFPIHLLDDENRKLVNPIVDTAGGSPSSEGYAGGSRPDSLTTTGGRPIGGVGETDDVRPVDELPSSGVVYNSQGEKNTQDVHA